MEEKESKRYKKTGISLWLAENWRSMAFVTYFLICLGDFLILPMIYAAMGSMDIVTLVQLSMQYKDPTVQAEFLKLYAAKIWVPLTVQGAGSFHIAFGTILGAGAWTRGQAEVAQIHQNQPPVHFNPNPTPPPIV